MALTVARYLSTERALFTESGKDTHSIMDNSNSPNFQRQEEDTWTELNSDILYLVLSRLPEASVLRAASVCKRWNAVTQTPTFTEQYKKTRSANSCNDFVCGANGVHYAITERVDGGGGGGGFEFRSLEKSYTRPTVSCSDDGEVPTVEAAGGMHLAFTGVEDTILRYKLSLVERRWRTTSPMPDVVQDPVVGVVMVGNNGGSGDHKLVVAGGLRTYSEEDEDLGVLIYEGRTGLWNRCAPLPSKFRGCGSSMAMAAVVHENRFYVYSIRSGFVSWLDLDSMRWSAVEHVRPSAKVSQLFLVSRSGVLYMVGVQEEEASESRRQQQQQEEVSFTVWKVVTEGGAMRVGMVVHSSVIASDGDGPPSTIGRWASSATDVSRGIVAVLLFLLLQLIICSYRATTSAACFLGGIISATVVQTQQRSTIMLGLRNRSSLRN